MFSSDDKKKVFPQSRHDFIGNGSQGDVNRVEMKGKAYQATVKPFQKETSRRNVNELRSRLAVRRFSVLEDEEAQR